MILPSNLIWFNGIDKLWAFEIEGSKWPKRQYHTLKTVSFDAPSQQITNSQNIYLDHTRIFFVPKTAQVSV